MRKPFLGSAFALTFATMVGASPALAADEGKMVTGTVTEASSETGMIVVDGETYTMAKQVGHGDDAGTRRQGVPHLRGTRAGRRWSPGSARPAQ